MTQEELREQIDKIGRAIQSLPYGEQDDRFYHEEIDALESLITEEKKAAVEEFEDRLLVTLALCDVDAVRPISKVVLRSMFPTS